jgi:hypothetical protein
MTELERHHTRMSCYHDTRDTSLFRYKFQVRSPCQNPLILIFLTNVIGPM